MRRDCLYWSAMKRGFCCFGSAHYQFNSFFGLPVVCMYIEEIAYKTRDRIFNASDLYIQRNTNGTVSTESKTTTELCNSLMACCAFDRRTKCSHIDEAFSCVHGRRQHGILWSYVALRRTDSSVTPKRKNEATTTSSSSNSNRCLYTCIWASAAITITNTSVHTMNDPKPEQQAAEFVCEPIWSWLSSICKQK